MSKAMEFWLSPCLATLCSIFVKATADVEETENFGVLHEIYEPVSIAALLGSCPYDENAKWTRADEENFRRVLLDQMRIVCLNGSEHPFCNSEVNISRVQIFFDSTATKQQRMFWNVKLTFLYPDHPYLSAQRHSESPIFDKEILSALLAELNQRPNATIPGWFVVDYERPHGFDPFTETINVYIVPVGVCIIIATAFVTWIGIKIRATTTVREMEALREYKMRKRQRDFLRRQRDALHSNYPLVRDHIHVPGLAPLASWSPDSCTQRRSVTAKATSAIRATVVNTAVMLTAGSLELDHILRLHSDAPSPTASSRGSDNFGGDSGPRSRRCLPTVDVRRRSASAAPAPGNAVTLRTHFIFTPLSTKPMMDIRDLCYTKL